jgi:two-component sensor histidine kinase
MPNLIECAVPAGTAVAFDSSTCNQSLARSATHSLAAHHSTTHATTDTDTWHGNQLRHLISSLFDPMDDARHIILNMLLTIRSALLRHS